MLRRGMASAHLPACRWREPRPRAQRPPHAALRAHFPDHRGEQGLHRDRRRRSRSRRTSIDSPSSTVSPRNSMPRSIRARPITSPCSAAIPSASTTTMPITASRSRAIRSARHPAAPTTWITPSPSAAWWISSRTMDSLGRPTWKASRRRARVRLDGRRAISPCRVFRAEVYAVKHNGFMTFKRVQDDPRRADKDRRFRRARARSRRRADLPNYAHIVPNQCNEMHGRDDSPGLPRTAENRMSKA